MVQTFAKLLIPVGGGGGGGGSAAGSKNRVLLEQTVGRVYLDRINGYPVGNVAEIYRSMGGTDPTVIATLQKSFGNNFDAVATKGIGAINSSIRTGLSDALRSENLHAPITPEFRDLLFHVDDGSTVGALRANIRAAGGGTGGGAMGGGGGMGGGMTGGGMGGTGGT